MNFLKKLFKGPDKKEEKIEPEVSLSLDDSFVHNFIDKGGKFLYCLKKEDVLKNFQNIVAENNWHTITYKNKDLEQFIAPSKIKTETKYQQNLPFFTTCEYLIAENGSILFSSKQLEDMRLSTLTSDFIVYATTSQIVKSKDDSLTGIKIKYRNDLPTNISPVKDYNLNANDDNFLNYGSNNSKNLYLLLFEDL